MAALTDEYRVGTWPIKDGFDVDANVGKILELRVFNKNSEYKWFRGCVGEKFNYRLLEDNEETKKIYEEPIEERQILDIDFSPVVKNGIEEVRKYEIPGIVRMSRGGKFYLPLEKEEKSGSDKSKEKTCGGPCAIVKYYIPKYDSNDSSTIHAYVKDWRLAGFAKEVTGDGNL